jgi:hypothetical protein
MKKKGTQEYFQVLFRDYLVTESKRVRACDWTIVLTCREVAVDIVLLLVLLNI